MAFGVISVVLLFIGLISQLIAFTTTSLYINKMIVTDKQGIFQRCSIFGKCIWLTSDLFDHDPSTYLLV